VTHLEPETYAAIMGSSAEVSVSEAVSALRLQGYTNDFSVTTDGQLRCGSCGEHPPQSAVVELTRRFEGMSDPDDEAVIFGLRCQECDSRGVLVAAYGPAASAGEAAVLTALPDANERF